MLSVPNDFLWQIATRLIATVIFSLLVYIFRGEILLRWNRIKNYVFDSKVQIDLTRVDRYEEAPTDPLDMDLFQSLKEDFEDIAFEGLSENCLRVSVPEIPTPLELRVEHEPALGGSHGENERYELQIKTQTPMTFGYRSDECLQEFERVAEDISNHAGNRFSTTSNTTFLTGTLYGQAPVSGEGIEDEGLGMRAELRESTLEMRFDDPRRLVRGIRKYFRPIQ